VVKQPSHFCYFSFDSYEKARSICSLHDCHHSQFCNISTYVMCYRFKSPGSVGHGSSGTQIGGGTAKVFEQSASIP
jgi:hypothetical protein